MTARLNRRFAELKAANRAALVVYVAATDPEGFTALLQEAMKDPMGFVDAGAAELAAEVFGATYAEIRVPSGAIANLYAFMIEAKAGDCIIAPPGEIGGHVTHHGAGAAGVDGVAVAACEHVCRENHGFDAGCGAEEFVEARRRCDIVRCREFGRKQVHRSRVREGIFAAVVLCGGGQEAESFAQHIMVALRGAHEMAAEIAARLRHTASERFTQQRSDLLRGSGICSRGSVFRLRQKGARLRQRGMRGPQRLIAHGVLLMCDSPNNTTSRVQLTVQKPRRTKVSA